MLALDRHLSFVCIIIIGLLFSALTATGKEPEAVSGELPAWNIQIDHGEMKELPSRWDEYFGVHYSTYDGPWMTVRGYGGPHVRAVEQEDSPAHIGPFSGRAVHLSLNDIRRYGEKAKGRPLSELIPEILERRLKVIYPLNVQEMGDKDLCYWMVRLVYEQFPDAVDHVYFQLGNEVNGLMFDPTGIRQKIRETGESQWKYVNTKEKQELYVDGYVAPTIEAIRRASMDVYGDPERIRVMLGSVANIYNEKSRNWMYEVLDREIAGDKAPTLKGMPLWKYVDIATIHYTFAGAGGSQTMQEIFDRCVKTGKVEAVWITEEHGNKGRGPVTIAGRGLQFMDWAARSGISADQSRLIWWGADMEKPGGKGMGTVELLGEFFGNATLWMQSERLKNAQVYLLAAGSNGIIDKLMAAIIPSDSEAIGPGKLTISLPAVSLDMEWSARAIQLSKDRPPVEEDSPSVMKENQLTLMIGREIDEPFLLLVTGKKL